MLNPKKAVVITWDERLRAMQAKSSIPAEDSPEQGADCEQYLPVPLGKNEVALRQLGEHPLRRRSDFYRVNIDHRKRRALPGDPTVRVHFQEFACVNLHSTKPFPLFPADNELHAESVGAAVGRIAERILVFLVE